jgi:cephalosporin-C deacetylase-like acetyl esterase
MRTTILAALLLVPALLLAIEPPAPGDVVGQIKYLVDPNVADQRKGLVGVPDDIKRRLKEANLKSTAAWQQIDSREAWEKFRQAKLADLRASLNWPSERCPLKTRVAGTLPGEGFTVDNLVFMSRTGLWVTANLYRPEKPSDKMPGILICHSHHNPKTESELQTMGMTWARAGCLVLVMDQLGHGERRQHPFRAAEDYPKETFRAGRQDYWFRYDTSLQLYLAGESLMGYIAWDLSRGVDVLLSQDGIDGSRIILLGAVAGGGDPTAVAAALDERITVAAPFNFGGPQPESRYPLPDDAELAFSYAGSGSWESTRNLAQSASSGFLPWVIVGSIAPRKLIYAHEFSWDREHDPVWKRLNQIYAWYGEPESLAFAHGSGTVQGKPPEATHCNNIGAVHRKFIHAALKKWYGIEVDPDNEYRKTFSSDQLRCLTPEIRQAITPRNVRELLADQSAKQSAELKAKLAAKPIAERRELLRTTWQRMLKSPEIKVTTPMAWEVRAKTDEVELPIRIEQSLVDEDHPVPTLLLLPEGKDPRPLVVGVAQQGKGMILRERAAVIVELLKQGIGVALVDVRGTGQLATSERGRDRTSYASDLSASELMLGGTMLGQQLYEFRRALRSLRENKQIDAKRIALWGESFAPITDGKQNIIVPHGVDRPSGAEPLGGMLVLLAGLFEEDVRAIAVHRSLWNYASAFDGPCVYLPHDAIVPGAAAAGDVSLLVEQLVPTPVKLLEMTSAMNQPWGGEAMDDQQLPKWFVDQLKR